MAANLTEEGELLAVGATTSRLAATIMQARYVTKRLLGGLMRFMELTPF